MIRISNVDIVENKDTGRRNVIVYHTDVTQQMETEKFIISQIFYYWNFNSNTQNYSKPNQRLQDCDTQAKLIIYYILYFIF